MRSADDIISAINGLKRAYEHFGSVQREYPGSRLAQMMKLYSRKVEWIINDFITCPQLTDRVRADLKKEWETDAFIIPALMEKVCSLPSEQREVLETIVDYLLEGDVLKIEVLDKKDAHLLQKV